MKNTDFPLKKTFEQEFITEKGDSLFILKYYQATIDEYDEHMALSPENKHRSTLALIRKQIPYTWKEKIIKFFFPKYVSLIERSLDLELVIKNVEINRFRIYNSIFNDVPSYMFKKKEGESRGLYSANLSTVCKEYNISIHDLRKNMTLEQYFWMVDGIHFQGNEQTKEGKAINRMALIDKEAIQARAEKTRLAFQSRKTKK